MMLCYAPLHQVMSHESCVLEGMTLASVRITHHSITITCLRRVYGSSTRCPTDSVARRDYADSEEDRSVSRGALCLSQRQTHRPLFPDAVGVSLLRHGT